MGTSNTNHICPKCGLEDDSDRCPLDGAIMVQPEALATHRAKNCYPLLGTLFAGKYLINGVVGRGSFGQVYLAKDTTLGRSLAIKTIRDLPDANSEQLHARFFREAKAAARLDNNPVCVSVYDYGSHEGALYIVMPYIDGVPLSAIITQQAPLPAARAVDLMRQVLRGLAAAHAEGLIHRDVKPDNIMITHGAMGEAQVKLLDFGIAKLRKQVGEAETVSTREGLFIGTAAYAPPEQAVDRVDERSDLYSVGVVLFELLTNTKPFAASTPIGLLWAHRDQPVPLERLDAAGVPPALREVVAHALQKHPEDRYPNAKAMADALARAIGLAATGEQAVLLSEPISTHKHPSSLIHPVITDPPSGRNKLLLLALPVLALLIGVPLWLIRAEPPKPAPTLTPHIATPSAAPSKAPATAPASKAPATIALSPLDQQLNLIHEHFSEGDLTATEAAIRAGLKAHPNLRQRLKTERRFAGLRGGQLWRRLFAPKRAKPSARRKLKPRPAKIKRTPAKPPSQPKPKPKTNGKVW